MVLPSCHRVTYCRYVLAMARAVPVGFARSTTRVVTLRVLPSGESSRLEPRMSIPDALLPPITGYSASPGRSANPLTGAFDGPLTAVPSRPSPEDWRAIVMTPAPG